VQNGNLERIRKVASVILSVPGDTILETTGRDNLAQWDSLSHLTLVSALEEEFGIQFTADEMHSAATVKDFLQLLDKYR
jgi:acyl carrier protein